MESTVNTLNYIQTEDCTGTAMLDPWGDPYLIDTIVNNKSIELVYRQDSQFTYTTIGIDLDPDIKIFKVIYSCKKGKWHKSEKIKGQYISASDETYEF